MSPDDVRGRLLRLIQEYPGLHLRELAREADTTEQLASYHVKALADEGTIEDIHAGGYRRIYPAQDAAARADQQALALLRNPPTARIALLLLERGPSTNPQIRQALGIAKSTTSYHLKRLVEAGLVRDLGQGHGYTLAQPRRVERLLRDWKPHGNRTERFMRMWDELYRAKRG